MRKKIRDLAASPRARLAGLMLLYLAVSLALLPRFLHAINPDGISYISTARRVLAGDWNGAVNGYWAPLYAWALVPLLALRIDPLLAGKLLGILIGLATLPGLDALAGRFSLTGRQRTLVLAALLPALWRFTFHFLTPDFLLAGVLIWYFSIVFAPDFLDRPRHAVACGALGALAYLAKAYGFYFFLAHFALMAALLWLGAETRARRRAALRQAALGLAIFALLAGAWITALSVKYGGFTVTASARYNHAVMGPDSPGHPMKLGFLAPTDAAAISVWEDPSALAPPDWSPTDSKERLIYQGQLIARNLRAIARTFQQYAPLLLFILAAYLLVGLHARCRFLRPGGEAYPLFTLLLYPAGYALLLVRDRYLYVCLPLLALMGAQLLRWLEEKELLSGWRRPAAWSILALSIAFLPAQRMVKLYRLQGKLVTHEISADLAKKADLNGATIASNGEWVRTLAVAYHLGSRYYGQKGITPDSLIRPELFRLGVRYYFAWNASPAERALFKDCRDVSGGAVPGLRVYRLDGPPPVNTEVSQAPAPVRPPPHRRKKPADADPDADDM